MIRNDQDLDAAQDVRRPRIGWVLGFAAAVALAVVTPFVVSCSSEFASPAGLVEASTNLDLEGVEPVLRRVANLGA